MCMYVNVLVCTYNIYTMMTHRAYFQYASRIECILVKHAFHYYIYANIYMYIYMQLIGKKYLTNQNTL